ncbi:hypothetical protein SUDANB171_01480 [Streptomyces sp. enrichment culture]|jgi:hypothetical protein|uniref:hypothetical protein n=1 Tax=Streptomyces sp. enrichment culture TaxID=1795815 RepID=UPI003F57C233
MPTLLSSWAAIRTPRLLGAQALARLRTEPGPTLVHPAERKLYILVHASSAGTWRHADTEVVPAELLALPEPQHVRPPGPYWLIPPGQRGQRTRLTDAADLRAAMMPHASCRRHR